MRAALYARVSTEEQVEGYSVDAQRRAFEALVAGRGWTAYREYIEEGKSARSENINKRPVFKEMIADALASKFDILVVHKLDRFSRNLRVTLEYFEKLSKAGVTFVSISEQMDFATPWGTFALTMLGGLAQLYSDNLSQECKKGWAERKAQGLYCGLLPFGTVKREDGIPRPDTRELVAKDSDGNTSQHSNYEGLVLAFSECARGASDAEIARTLNAKGFRTTGNRGPGLFSKNTVRGMLTNEFYLGLLPDGNRGWIKAKHGPFIPQELWDQAQAVRERNRRTPRNHPRKGTICSSTGITYCWYCRGRMHVGATKNGRRRLICSTRAKGLGCPQKLVFLDVYEEQIALYLETFHIPEGYQEKILEAHRKLENSYSDIEKKKTKLQSRLERTKKLFKWGDIAEAEYLLEKAEIMKELRRLEPAERDGKALERLAEFLRSVTTAWTEANQEQRNNLARQLFDEIWVKDKQVIAVKPRPELEAFFQLSYEEWLKQFESDDSNPLDSGAQYVGNS